MTSEQMTGTVHLQTGYSWWGLLFFFVLVLRPRLEINHQPISLPGWGESSHEVAAGDTRITVYIPLLMPRGVGEATLLVDVPPNGNVSLRYRAPVLAFLSGKLAVVG